MSTHVNGKHKERAMASSSTRSVQSFFRPQVSSSVIKVEALWTTFVVEHNLAFNASDHANN